LISAGVTIKMAGAGSAEGGDVEVLASAAIAGAGRIERMAARRHRWRMRKPHESGIF